MRECSRSCRSAALTGWLAAGVLWSGAVPIEGSIETLAALHAAGKRLFFVTNNSTKSRAFYVRKLQGKGLAFVTENEILNSSYAAAELLKNDPKFKGEVFVIGENGIYEELSNVGITVANPHGECLAYQGPPPQPLWSEIPTALDHPELEENVGAVLVGFDRYLNYTKISKAMLHLQNPDCLFYATNTDMSFPTARGILPGSGSTLQCISACSGREPTVCGKPSSHLMEVIKLRADIDPSRTLMVGDRLAHPCTERRRGSLLTAPGSIQTLSSENRTAPRHF